MSKKALLSILLIGCLMFGVGAGTFAWFTSQATSAGNTFTAGTLAITANDGNKDFEIDIDIPQYMQPGDITGEASITVKNTGNLNAATFGKFTIAGDLAQDLYFYDYKVEFFDADGTKKEREDNFITNGVPNPTFYSQYGNTNKISLYNWVNGPGPLDCYGATGTPWDMEALKPGEYFTIKFKLAYDTDATVQGRTLGLGYLVRATQVNADAISALELAPSFYVDNHIQYLLDQVQ